MFSSSGKVFSCFAGFEIFVGKIESFVGKTEICFGKSKTYFGQSETHGIKQDSLTCPNKTAAGKTDI